MKLDGDYLVRTKLWLPEGAAQVRFGISIKRVNGLRDEVESVFDLMGGKTRNWTVVASGLRGTFDLFLWTEIGPAANTNHKAWARFYSPILLSSEERWNADNADLTLKAELNKQYARADPWCYDSTPDDKNRRVRMLGALAVRRYRRVLDIGCGDGFLTFALPGDYVLGVDLSDKAVELANVARQRQADSERFQFGALGFFDLMPDRIGQFDLIVVTGVLYPQYIGNSWMLVANLIDRLLLPGGILATCHIHEWTRHHFPYARVHQSWYGYRGYTHCLEVYCK